MIKLSFKIYKEKYKKITVQQRDTHKNSKMVEKVANNLKKLLLVEN